MDALMPALVAVAVTEIGGKVQKGVRVFSLKGGEGGVFAALMLSSAIYYSVAAFGGAAISHMLNSNAKLLFMAMSLVFAGAPMLLTVKPVVAKKGGFAGSFIYFVNNQFADASAFILLAIAVRTDTPFVGLVGGLFGIAVVAAAPILLGQNWPEDKILTQIRRLVGLAIILLAVAMALRALRLV